MNDHRKETALGLIREGQELIRLGRELAQTIGIEIPENISNGALPSHLKRAAKKVPRKKVPRKKVAATTKATKTKATKKELAGRPLQLRKFFSTHGPSRRSVIIEKTKMPVGTISVLLNKHCENKKGVWDWRNN